jgi:hypothetical protein
LVVGFNPSEKNARQFGLLSPIHGKIKNVPNHQPAMDCEACRFSLHLWDYTKREG